MSGQLPELHELESEVMGVVWDGPPHTTVRDVLVEVNRRAGRERAYTTILTIMRRLDSKGLLERHRQGKTDVYRARLSREAFATQRAQERVRALVDEFGDVALVNFAAEMSRLDPVRREHLRRLARRRHG